MEFHEWLYHRINDTDFDNKEDVIELVQYLAAELLRYHKTATAYDKELKKRMTYEAFDNWASDLGKELLEDDMARLPDDNAFKQFFEKNKEMILGKDVNEE